MKRGFRRMWRLAVLLIVAISSLANSDPTVEFGFSNINDDIYQQPVNLMSPGRPKTAHAKDQMENREQGVYSRGAEDSWAPFDFSKFDDFLSQHTSDADHNRVKRRAKRRRGSRRRRLRSTTSQPDDTEPKNQSTSEQPDVSQSGRRADLVASQHGKQKKHDPKQRYDTYDPPIKEWESGFVEMPKDLYQAHLRPGVIFRIHMSEAVLKMQYRKCKHPEKKFDSICMNPSTRNWNSVVDNVAMMHYGEDKDESVIEADVEYLRLTRKVINDEITKFEDLKWLVGWFNNRSELIQEHMCNTRYFAVGTPPTMFTHAEEYMKRMCLFDNVYIDHIPYVVGEDGSLMAAVAPPVLHCDAATCTSVPFIDSVMFDERLGRSNVRTLTRCQASCRAHCRNDPDCLKRCSDRCLRND